MKLVVAALVWSFWIPPYCWREARALAGPGCDYAHHNAQALTPLVIMFGKMASLAKRTAATDYRCDVIPGNACDGTIQFDLPARLKFGPWQTPAPATSDGPSLELATGVPSFAAVRHAFYSRRTYRVIGSDVLIDLTGSPAGMVRQSPDGRLFAFLTTKLVEKTAAAPAPDPDHASTVFPHERGADGLPRQVVSAFVCRPQQL